MAGKSPSGPAVFYDRGPCSDAEVCGVRAEGRLPAARDRYRRYGAAVHMPAVDRVREARSMRRVRDARPPLGWTRIDGETRER